MRRRLVAGFGLAAVVALVTAASPASSAGAAGEPVDVQLLAMNDFHGRFEALAGSDSQLAGYPDPVGGAAYIPPLMDQLHTSFTDAGGDADNSLFVGAGDLISASPFASSVFKDEPSIEVLNALGLDFSSVGNHEFDHGQDELQRIQNGGCVGEPGVDSCFRDDQFAGADFPYLAANVVDNSTGEPILPPYEIREMTGPDGPIKMGFIGVVTKTTPTLVTPTGVAGLTFADEADTINKYSGELTDQGVQAIAVLIHEGGTEAADTTYNDCESGFSGPIADINARTSADVDLIISAHTHFAYTCVLPDPAGNPRHITQAGDYGKLLTDIRLQVDSETGDVIRTPDDDTVTATNNPVVRTATPDPTVQSIVDYWVAKAADAQNEVIGQQTAAITRGENGRRDVESTLGNLIADAQLAATSEPGTGDAVLALMNPGGLRSDLSYTNPVDGLDDVTYGEAFNVQPFGNTVNTTTLTGAQIKEALEQQWNLAADGSEAFLQLSVSDGFHYVYDPTRPIGDRVDPNQMTLDGELIDPAANYRVTANSFLTAGGDGFVALGQGTDTVTGPVDVDSFVDYVKANTPISPPALGRVEVGQFTTPTGPTSDVGIAGAIVSSALTGEVGQIDTLVGNAGPDGAIGTSTLSVAVAGPLSLVPAPGARPALDAFADPAEAQTVSANSGAGSDAVADDTGDGGDMGDTGETGLATMSADSGDELDAAPLDTAAPATTGEWTIDGQSATVTVTDLASGQAAVLSLGYQLSPEARLGDPITVTLTVTGPEGNTDPDPANNTVTLTGAVVDGVTPGDDGGTGGGPGGNGNGGDNSAELAYTGVETAPQIAFGAGLLAAGLALVLAAGVRRKVKTASVLPDSGSPAGGS